MFGYLILLIACVIMCQIFDYKLEGKVLVKKLLPSIAIALLTVFIILVIIAYGGVMFLDLSYGVTALEYLSSVFVDILVPLALLFVASLSITKIYQRKDKIFAWVFIGMAVCLAIAIPLECVDIYYTKIEITKLAYISYFDAFAKRSWPKFTYIIYTLTLIPSVLLILSTYIVRCRKISIVENIATKEDY